MAATGKSAVTFLNEIEARYNSLVCYARNYPILFEAYCSGGAAGGTGSSSGSPKCNMERLRSHWDQVGSVNGWTDSCETTPEAASRLVNQEGVVRVANKHCFASQVSGAPTFTSLQAALKGCAGTSGCGKLYSPGCLDSIFRLCEATDELRPSEHGSCAYVPATKSAVLGVILDGADLAPSYEEL